MLSKQGGNKRRGRKSSLQRKRGGGRDSNVEKVDVEDGEDAVVGSEVAAGEAVAEEDTESDEIMLEMNLARRWCVVSLLGHMRWPHLGWKRITAATVGNGSCGIGQDPYSVADGSNYGHCRSSRCMVLQQCICNLIIASNSVVGGGNAHFPVLRDSDGMSMKMRRAIV